jgi:hypothetical protein
MDGGEVAMTHSALSFVLGAIAPLGVLGWLVFLH